MIHTAGRDVRAKLLRRVDVVVVGSGPAGSAAARELALGGASVAVIEAGPLVSPERFLAPAFDAMADLYRGMSATVVLGRAPIPYVQGRMVGGSSPINGAICWRLPRDVWERWVAADPALGEGLPWGSLEAATDLIEARLQVTPTSLTLGGPKSRLMAAGADALGLEHRPIRRNIAGCEGLGRCLQGCPRGKKLSVDLSLLADAREAGAWLLSEVEITRIDTRGGRVVGVSGVSAGGGVVTIEAERVVLAASAVQTPALLLRSGLTSGPVGRNFQCHPGASMAGRFPEVIRMWEGATQGYEVTGLRHEGLKFESLGFGPALLLARLAGAGQALSRELGRLERYLEWGAAIRATGRGRVRVFRGRPVVTWSPTRGDIALLRRGLRVMGEMMLAAGAEAVQPGTRGFAAETSSLADLVHLEERGPRSPSAFTLAITHMFGTCAAGSDPEASVVRPDLRHHRLRGLYIVDSSVFPTNLGVNPQIPIMAVATLGARAVLASLGGSRWSASRPSAGAL